MHRILSVHINKVDNPESQSKLTGQEIRACHHSAEVIARNCRSGPSATITEALFDRICLKKSYLQY